MTEETDDDLFVTQNSFSNSTVELDLNSEFDFVPFCPLEDNFINNFDLGSLNSELASNTCDGERNEVNSSNVNPTDSDDEVLQATNAVESQLKDETLRFGTPLSTSEMKGLRDSAFSTNTENKSAWAVKLYNSWKNERNNRNLIDVSDIKKDLISLAEDENELNTVLMCFVTEVRNMKGGEYRGNTLYEIVSSLQYYLRRNDKPVNFFDEACYAGLRSVLDARMKEIARKGIGINKRQAAIISEEQEDILWRKQFLGEDTPQQLLDTLVYLIGLNFALRAGDEHRFLRVGSASQFEVLVASSGETSLKYTEDISKTNQGGLKHRKLERKTVTVGENHHFPERCLVRLFEKYISLR